MSSICSVTAWVNSQFIDTAALLPAGWGLTASSKNWDPKSSADACLFCRSAVLTILQFASVLFQQLPSLNHQRAKLLQNNTQLCGRLFGEGKSRALLQIYIVPNSRILLAEWSQLMHISPPPGPAPQEPNLCFLSLWTEHHPLHAAISTAKAFSSRGDFFPVRSSNEWILGKLRPHTSI